MTRSSNGMLPRGVMLYIFTFQDGEEIESFHESDPDARMWASSTRGIVQIVQVLSGKVIFQRETKTTP